MEKIKLHEITVKQAVLLEPSVLKKTKLDYSKKNKAIRMFLAGTKKGTICKKFKIKHEIFDHWVGGCDVKEFRKKTAFQMHRNGIAEGEICRELGLGPKGNKKLQHWIKAGYEREDWKRQLVLTRRAYEHKDGRTQWVTHIIKEASKQILQRV